MSERQLENSVPFTTLSVVLTRVNEDRKTAEVHIIDKVTTLNT